MITARRVGLRSYLGPLKIMHLPPEFLMTRKSRLSKADLDLLKTFDAPTVCNVVDLFEIRPKNVGYTDGTINCCFPDLPPMVGYACTMRFRSRHVPAASETAVSVEEQLNAIVELGGPAVAVIQDLDTPPAAACFGDMRCKMLQTFGSTGLVTSGLGRDLHAIEPLKFPIFVNSVACSHGYDFMESIGLPVQVGGCNVAPGELLFGDRNGILTIPNDIASQVPSACVEYAKAEKILLDYLDGDSPTPKGTQQAILECKAQVARLKTQLISKG